MKSIKRFLFFIIILALIAVFGLKIFKDKPYTAQTEYGDSIIIAGTDITICAIDRVVPSEYFQISIKGKSISIGKYQKNDSGDVSKLYEASTDSLSKEELEQTIQTVKGMVSKDNLSAINDVVVALENIAAGDTVISSEMVDRLTHISIPDDFFDNATVTGKEFGDYCLRILNGEY